MGANDGVDRPGLAYDEMATQGRWDLLAALESTQRMIEGRERWLPWFDVEKGKAYEARLLRNFLHSLFSRSVDTMVSKPYCRNVGWSEDLPLPKQLEDLLYNVDGRGTSITALSRARFDDEVRYGLSHVLVDFSTIERNLPQAGDSQASRRATRGEEAAAGARVNLIRISPPNLIDWESETIKGVEVLVGIRYRGNRLVRNGFAQTLVPTITHHQAHQVDIYEQNGEAAWILVSSTPHTFGSVPLVTTYINQTGYMTAMPPMLDLAETNLCHWQVNSDYLALLNVVSISRFFTKGFHKDEKSASSIIGASKAIHAASEGADAKWVEHSGAGIGSLESALQKIEDRAAMQSSRPTSRNKSAVTATGEVRDASDAICDLLAWVGAEEEGLLRMFEIAANWLNVELPDDFAFEIYKGFTLGRDSHQEMAVIQKDAIDGRITGVRCLIEAKRRGIYADDMIPEQEFDDAQTEALQRVAALIPTGQGDFEPDDNQAS